MAYNRARGVWCVILPKRCTAPRVKCARTTLSFPGRGCGVWLCNCRFVTQDMNGVCPQQAEAWRVFGPPGSGLGHPPPHHPSPGHPSAGHPNMPHFLPSPALASPGGSSCSPSGQPHPPQGALVQQQQHQMQTSALFVTNLGQFVSEHELKDIFSRWVMPRLGQTGRAPRGTEKGSAKGCAASTGKSV